MVNSFLYKNIVFLLFSLVMIGLVGGILKHQYAAEHSAVLIADPRVLAIPVSDNQDPIVNLKNQSIIAYGPSPEIPNNLDYTQLRQTVYDKLVQAQALLPAGVKFELYEGYRSLTLQKTLFEARYAQVKQSFPASASHAAVFTETTRLVSPVVNLDGSHNIPPHSTGGAFDLYLIDEAGQPLDMGIHPKDWMLDQDGGISRTDSEYISEQAKKNRALMSKALAEVGFVNYPAEYWHWSYGDRYWAFKTQQTQALYGSYISASR